MAHWLLQHYHLPQYINLTWFFFLFPSQHISHVNPFMCYSTSVTLMYIIMGSLKKATAATAYYLANCKRCTFCIQGVGGGGQETLIRAPQFHSLIHEITYLERRVDKLVTLRWWKLCFSTRGRAAEAFACFNRFQYGNRNVCSLSCVVQLSRNSEFDNLLNNCDWIKMLKTSKQIMIYL